MRIQSLKDALRCIPDPTGLWVGNDLKQVELKIHSLFPSELTVENLNSWQAQEALNIAQLVRVQIFQDDLSRATSTLRLFKVFCSRFEDTYSSVHLHYLLESGRLLSWSMQPARAHELCAKAWQLALSENNGFSAIDAGLMISNNQRTNKQTEWSKVLFNQAKKSNSPDAKLWLPLLYFNDAWSLFDSHRFNDAYESIQRALDYPLDCYYKDFGLSLYWSKARILRELEKYNEAMAIQNLLMQEMSECPQKGYVHLELGESMQLLGEISEAKSQFSEAHKLLSLDPWCKDNHKNELDRIKHLIAQR